MVSRRLLGWGVLVLLGTACSAARPAVVKASSEEGTGGAGPVAEVEPRRYVDEELGFEFTRPGGEWLLDETDEETPEGLAIPVVLRHRSSGAQVVLQVAPAVATPTQFAERLTVGLRSQPGFSTTDPHPLRLSDSAVGFDFSVGDSVRGRVAVRDGSPGRVFMMLATWPTTASAEVLRNVDAVFESIRPLPDQT
ncbi:MAG TPA: hypothetical protein VLQ93_04285 [Myxococcaceae bacterium]|nr:hypothetical protein [Myxococcaceae bacterium]